MLSTDLAKHPAGHAVMAQLAKAELAVDIAPHPALAPLRTLRWMRSAAAELTASQARQHVEHMCKQCYSLLH